MLSLKLHSLAAVRRVRETFEKFTFPGRFMEEKNFHSKLLDKGFSA